MRSVTEGRSMGVSASPGLLTSCSVAAPPNPASFRRRIALPESLRVLPPELAREQARASERALEAMRVLEPDRKQLELRASAPSHCWARGSGRHWCGLTSSART